jgi:23S rRNA (pseudouridine1915-N3)-methyltransferase
MREEAERILAAVGSQDDVVALEVTGKPWSTEQLADHLHGWLADGQDRSLLIGGADGLHADCLARARLRWSLSPLTLPHGLVRVVLGEQLYRAHSILQGHPYHRG